ncbi:hypothetical protein OsI_24527 [Oryza sativa Indica Group]|uniref:non-specific serine/threonine protein kinase n=1 Tax=Oryza sativa subsp. indica TaxID=39946 RepID=B8B2L6_ORYSI|nr:hypothetical protein OsI_24527 [Oryza sativa Indica Group]
MGNCASAIDSFFFTKRANNENDDDDAAPGMSASKRTTSSTTTGKLSTLSNSTFIPSTISGVSTDDAYPDGQILESPNLRIFTFAELKNATKNFRTDTVLGEGGFGKVYKGWVDERTMNSSKSSTGVVVAVKKLNPESVQGTEQWESEVNFLGRISHPNLVKLLGYCKDNDELLLVYEFMAKGSLENHLFRRGAVYEPLPWSLRLKILIGAARGLAFLHSSERQIIYRDFKASNILLDSNFNAKLSDFGLAKHGPDGGLSHVTTRVMGTYGYAAPEYVATGHLYVKSDVYGFGVVLLEMLSGLRALDPSRPSGKLNLVDWAKPLLADRRKLSQLMDSRLEGQYHSRGALQAAQLTLKCLSGDPKSRPSMKEVVEALEKIELIKSKSREPRNSSSLFYTSDEIQCRSFKNNEIQCSAMKKGMDDADKTIAYTDQDGRIKLFKVFRRKRKEDRTQELLQVDREAELNMRNVATDRSRNFSNKVRASYNIWRPGFHHTNTDSTLRLMKDQIIMAKVYATIAHSQKQPDLYVLLMTCIKQSQEGIGDAHMDYKLDLSALERAKAMGHALSSARDVLYNSGEVSRRLRVMLQSTELNIDSVKKQNSFLVQHAAKTVPMPLHCLHMQLTTDYHFRDGVVKEYFRDAALKEEEDKAKREDRSLYHYAIFSDNVLAASVVVRSTVTHAKEPEKHVFHIVTDRLNFAAMTMWFISNPPLPATVHVENIDNFKWLNSSYCSVLRQLESARLKEYYFKAHDPSSLSDGNENLKYRNPKYLSMLNHLRFYMPEIHPKLDKILFLDDDVVVQKDLTPLWDVDLKGIISENFDPHACGWAFGMNMFDLKEWKKQNITGIYHYWQDLNEDRKLWKLDTLPPGLITFYNLTYPLNRTWHVLGLGYDPSVDLVEIENAAVVHYNGNYKPWLDLAISKYKPYWSKYVDLDNSHIQRCYMSEQ